MWATNLKIVGLVVTTVLLYTLVANMIPQLESEVPGELTFSGQVTTEQLVAAGEELYQGAGGCTACHGLGTRAPDLLTDEAGQGNVAARCDRRVQGLACKEYLYQSMTEPNAYVVSGYQPIMPDMRRTLSAAQIWSVIAYLQSLGGEVTVTGEDIAKTEQAQGGAPGAQAPPAGAATASLDPMELLRSNQCLVCHKLGTEGGVIGPDLTAVGRRADAEYLRRAILEPNADTASGYAAVAGTMPVNFGQQLTAAQLEVLVRYLVGRK